VEHSIGEHVGRTGLDEIFQFGYVGVSIFFFISRYV
jgi:hypothetical protein